MYMRFRGGGPGHGDQGRVQEQALDLTDIGTGEEEVEEDIGSVGERTAHAQGPEAYDEDDEDDDDDDDDDDDGDESSDGGGSDSGASDGLIDTGFASE